MRMGHDKSIQLLAFSLIVLCGRQHGFILD